MPTGSPSPTPTPTPTPTATGFSLWDPGGCNCDCAAYPCSLPAATDLHVSLTWNGATGSGLIPYIGNCKWNTPSSAGSYFALSDGTHYAVFSIWYGSPSGCTTVDLQVFTGIPGSGNLFREFFACYPSGCATTPGGSWSMTLSSSTCSPLSITWTSTIDSMSMTLTL